MTRPARLALAIVLLAAGCSPRPQVAEPSGWEAFLAAPSSDGMEALSSKLATCERARATSPEPDACFESTGLTDKRFDMLLALAVAGDRSAIRMAMIVRPYAAGEWAARIDSSFGNLLDTKPMLLLSTAAKQCVPPAMVAVGSAGAASRAGTLGAIDDPELAPYRDAALKAAGAQE